MIYVRHLVQATTASTVNTKCIKMITILTWITASL